MNVVMATTGFYPAVSWGGPVKIVHQNVLELQRRGHNVTVVASNLLDKRRRIESGTFRRTVDGLDVHYLHTYVIPQWPGTLGPTWLAPPANRHLQGLIETADVVHVNATRNAIAVQTMRHAQKQGKLLIVQPHGTLPYIVNARWLKKVFDRLFLNRILKGVDVFIAAQEAEEKQIIAAGGRAEQIHIVPNGLQYETGMLNAYRGQFRQAYGIPDEQKIILFLGRVNRKKGTDLLVEAFARLPAGKRRDLLLVIAGPDDGQLDVVKALIDRRQLGANVLLTGLLEGDAVWAAHADADLFVLPCRVDTFPMAIVEACRAGTPLVVTETCEIAGLLDDTAGAVVPVDVVAITDAMVSILEDSALQRQYREGAQKLMETTFSIKAVGDALEHIYYQVRREEQPLDIVHAAPRSLES